VLEAVPFTPGDLPGYAGRLFDFLMENPDQLRLATWHRSNAQTPAIETAGLRESHHANVAAVAGSPALDGSDQALTPEDLYVSRWRLPAPGYRRAPMRPPPSLATT